MSLAPVESYRQVWLVKFEFRQPPGERPGPVCLVAREFRTGRTLRLWQDELRRLRRAPYPTGPDSLFVAYDASAELGCHLALGWPIPARICDPGAEFRCQTAGTGSPCGYSLLGALLFHGLDIMGGEEQGVPRRLIMRGAPWSQQEETAILSNCESTVESLGRLLPAMLPKIDLPRALLRGRYMAAVARMEQTGVPLDVELLAALRRHWAGLRARLVTEVDQAFGVYEGQTFKVKRWKAWLDKRGIAWPQLDSGALALDEDTFADQADTYPEIRLLCELRVSLARLRLADLSVGSDGRNRCPLAPFASSTGRNQPSTSKFIFGPAVWLRGLIKPNPGTALAYCDYSQQEFGIAAALSRDAAMRDAYRSSDPYLTFGKQAGRIPCEATKQTHAGPREHFKQCVLGVQYGMTEWGLARRLCCPPVQARELLNLHRETYREFWNWSDRALDSAMLLGRLQTAFGWTVHVGPDANPRSLRNFPMQANGAEILRLACCMATERGIRVCAPVHDALLVEGPAAEIEDVVSEVGRIMREASEIVLDGFPLRHDSRIVTWPNRYMDVRGREMWETVMKLLQKVPGQVAPALGTS